MVWKFGVVLKENNDRAEIVENYLKREITVRIIGNLRRDLMATIDREFSRIHKVFNLEASKDFDTLIPCNCQCCKNNKKHGGGHHEKQHDGSRGSRCSMLFE